MRRVCGGAVLVIVVLTVIGAGAPAEAGGSTFDFNRRWFAPGQLAVGRTRFSDWVGAQGRVAQGPYFAYLVRGNGWIEPPRLPRKAIRLGQVKMLRVEGTIWKASVRFVVPHVRPGSYMVSICNDPCRNAFVGDLVGAWIFVASSAEQARMKADKPTQSSDAASDGVTTDFPADADRRNTSSVPGELVSR